VIGEEAVRPRICIDAAHSVLSGHGGGDVPKRNAYGIELLADPTRRAIVALISVGVRRPASIAREIQLSRPATSRQLRILSEAGLIRWTWSRVDRRGRVYVIHPDMAGPITAWLVGVEIPHLTRPELGWSNARLSPGSGAIPNPEDDTDRRGDSALHGDGSA
jgi:hypothetical protein